MFSFYVLQNFNLIEELVDIVEIILNLDGYIVWFLHRATILDVDSSIDNPKTALANGLCKDVLVVEDRTT